MTAAKGHGRTGRPWLRLRAEILKRDPWCMIRGPRCTRVSTQVDHIVPLTVDPSRAHDPNNLRGVCAACNAAGGARITNARKAGRVARPVVERSVRDQPCTYERGDSLPCQVSCGGSIAPHACRLPVSYWGRAS